MLQAISPFIEIIIIIIGVNSLLTLFWNTRSIDLMLGVASFLFVFFLSSILPLPVLHKLLLLVMNVAAIAVVIIFQPELRVTLSKLSLKNKRHREITEFDKFLDQLTTSTYRMAENKIGALVVIEKNDSLNEYARKSIILKASFSSELLETIFSKNAPLHDGAVIIKDTTIIAASVILPLAETPHVQKTFGTRHRAGVGISLITDAVVIIVSEETGNVSLARDGVITKGIKIDKFKSIIRSIFYQEQEASVANKKFSLLKWIKK